jgi:hypothetical protein
MCARLPAIGISPPLLICWCLWPSRRARMYSVKQQLASARSVPLLPLPPVLAAAAPPPPPSNRGTSGLSPSSGSITSAAGPIPSGAKPPPARPRPPHRAAHSRPCHAETGHPRVRYAAVRPFLGSSIPATSTVRDAAVGGRRLGRTTEPI